MLVNQLEYVYILTKDNKIITILEHYRESGEKYEFNDFYCGGFTFSYDDYELTNKPPIQHFPNWVLCTLNDCEKLFTSKNAKKILRILKINKLNPNNVDKILLFGSFRNRKTGTYGFSAKIVDEKGLRRMKDYVKDFSKENIEVLKGAFDNFVFESINEEILPINFNVNQLKRDVDIKEATKL